MTASFTSKIRQAGLVLAIALSTSVISTQSFAFSAEVRSACYSDAFRLCAATIPNIPQTSACMRQHMAQLSPGCRAAVDKELSGKSKSVATNDR
jgi:hypothetical protein